MITIILAVTAIVTYIIAHIVDMVRMKVEDRERKTHTWKETRNLKHIQLLELINGLLSLIGIISIFLIFVLSIAWCFVRQHEPKPVEIKIATSICSLSDSSANKLNGSMFLLFGSVKSSDNIVYKYVENTDNGKIVKQLDGTNNNIYIIEDNSTSPKLITTYIHYERIKNSKLENIFFIDLSNYEKCPDDEVEYYTFYVPENSVSNNYNINLE